MNLQIRLASKILKLGGVISNPTDTIQGLSCLPAYEQSIQKVLHLKRRSSAKGLILLASNISLLEPYVEDMGLLKQVKIEQQPTTYLLKANKEISPLITGEFDTVAVRITDNPLIVNLCQRCNSALLSTSANISGKQSINSTLELNVQFKQRLDFILAQKYYNNQPSRIINLHTGRRLR